jgi:catechol 2,3-dioxygenase-like lactoylglutathione lyase family enzyme
MDPGAFSISLAVRDLAASRAFYEKLGFRSLGGDVSKHYVILKNGAAVVGLFQGMFEGNILTFNPGWDSSAQPLPEFTDVREIRRRAAEQGLEVLHDTTGKTPSGPASFVLKDPDGNVLLFDQHR